MERNKTITMNLEEYQEIMEYKAEFDKFANSVNEHHFTLNFNHSHTYNNYYSDYSLLELNSTLTKKELNEKVLKEIDSIKTRVDKINFRSERKEEIIGKINSIPKWIRKIYKIDEL